MRCERMRRGLTMLGLGRRRGCPSPPDLSDVRGQPFARRALEVAAAGGHHILLVGPPGARARRCWQSACPVCSRTSSTRRRCRPLASIPPRAWCCRREGSCAGRRFALLTISASLVSLVGGASDALRPGEVSMAGGGVLFLDELGEFQPAVLDALRQPLEEGVVRVSRARFTVRLSGAIPPHRGDEPLPLRPGRPAGQLSLFRQRAAPLSAAVVPVLCSTDSICGSTSPARR